MVWEWQVWRCFEDVKEIFEEKGWESGFAEGHDNEVMPLLAESGDYCIAFFKNNPHTGESWFELRDKVRRRVVFVQGVRNIPTPERAVKLLANYGAPSEIIAPHDRPLYSLPMAPVVGVAEAG